MKRHLLIAIGSLIFVRTLCAASSYDGSAIVNVQGYSSNPGYSVNGPYNQNPPTAVYVKGPAVSTVDCLSAVNSAIWTQCVLRPNCLNLSVADIRPNIVADLASRADANYVSACSGYIDGVFAQFKQQNGGKIQPTNFPTGGAPSVYGQATGPSNPFTYDNLTPYHVAEEERRETQLENLQQINQAQTGQQPSLTVQQMPTTLNDMNFSDRMNVIREGWQDPSVNKYPTYGQINVETDANKYERQSQEMQDRVQFEAAKSQFCTQYPTDPICP